MPKETIRYYEFSPFRIDIASRALLRDGVPVALTPKAFDLLLVLLEHAGTVLSRDDLLKLVWSSASVSPNIVSVNMTALRKALEDDADESKYISTVPRRGYRFVAKVREVYDDSDLPGAGSVRRVESPLLLGILSEQTRETLERHRWHILIACGIYACHYMIAVLLEIAYKFDVYGTKAIITAPIFFSWILITSVWGVAVVLNASRSYGLALCAGVFVSAAIVAFFGAWLVLPHIPVTEAKFQTFAAPAAYLKDIAYILPIALLFLIVPSHFVSALELQIEQGRAREVFELLSGNEASIRPAATIYLKTWVLGTLLTGWVAYSLPARAHLFDNLLPNPYLSLFEVLHQTRTMLQFALGLYCIAWYYRELNHLKSEAGSAIQ